MRLNFLKSPISLIAALVILVVCLLEISRVHLLQRMEWITYDWRVRLAQRHASHSVNDATNLGVVEISDNTIAEVNSGRLGYKYGLYWPRQVYARALDELTKQGAKAVAFDVLFAEERRDQPDYYYSPRASVASDVFFAQVLQDSSNAILAADQDLLPNPLFMSNAWRIGNIATLRDGDGVLRRDQAFKIYTNWNPIIIETAGFLELNLAKTEDEPGKITFYRKKAVPVVVPKDRDGMVETAAFDQHPPEGIPPRFIPFTLERVWSMGIVLAAYELKLDLDHPDIDLKHHRIVLHGENGLTRTLPVDAQGYFYIDWSMGLNDPSLTEAPFEELLTDYIDRAAGRPVDNQWRNKLVVIGSTATGNDLADLGSTPLSSVTYLVTKHWNVANSVITGRFIRDCSLAARLGLIILVGALAAWITWVVSRPYTGSILMMGTAVVYIAVAAGVFVHWRVWIPIITPLVCAGLMTHVSAVTYRVAVEQSERKRIKSLFSRLVSPEVVNEVLRAKQISLDSLAGEQREITVSFADIRGFTELTDAAQAENTEFVRRHDLSAQVASNYFDEQAKEVMKTVSLYLGTIADCVKKHQGTLDKYIGDCVMAFWGAPLPNPQHAVGAVRCAIDAQQALHALNVAREAENKRREAENFGRLRAGQPMLSRLPVLSMGTGINTGLGIAGFMGSERHIVNYTVFGREVNLASRLEGLSGHGRILIGEGTYLALQRDDPELAKTCVELPPKPVKGFRDRVRLFEVPWRPAAPPGQTAGEPGQARDNTPAVV